MQLSKEQEARLSTFKGSLEMVQFISFNSVNNWSKYLDASKLEINESRGNRRFELKVDMVLSGMNGKGVPYSFVTVDTFDDRSQLLKAVKGLEKLKQELGIDIYTLILKPDSSMKIVSKLRFLRPIFNLFFKIDKSKKFKPNVHLNQPERNATLTTLEEFKTLNQDDPFYNINLNKYFPVPSGKGQSKEEYYEQFSKDTAKATGPKVLGMGAYPAVSGKVLEILEGDVEHSMDDDWDNFILVYYPRRMDYLYLVPNLPEDIILKRKNAYERGIQFPCSKIN